MTSGIERPTSAYKIPITAIIGNAQPTVRRLTSKANHYRDSTYENIELVVITCPRCQVWVLHNPVSDGENAAGDESHRSNTEGRSDGEVSSTSGKASR